MQELTELPVNDFVSGCTQSYIFISLLFTNIKQGRNNYITLSVSLSGNPPF